MSKSDWKRRYDDLLAEYRMQQRWVSIELTEIRRHFPAIDELFAELADLIDAADPKRGAPVAIGRGGGDINGLEERGVDVGLKGSFDVRPAQDRIHVVNHDIRRLAGRVFDGLDVTGRRYAGAVLSSTRRCRHKECPDVGRRQHGMNVDGVRVCRTCSRPLAGGTDGP